MTSVVREWFRGASGGSAAGQAAPICAYNFGLPLKASGKDTGPWPAPGFQGLRLTAGRRPSNDVWLIWCGKIGPRFSVQTQGGLC